MLGAIHDLFPQVMIGSKKILKKQKINIKKNNFLIFNYNIKNIKK